MSIARATAVSIALTLAASAFGGPVEGQKVPRFEIELEGGPVWQSKNEVQIPNDDSGTRFSLEGLVGNGPWAFGRLNLYVNLNERHALRAVVAPLSIKESNTLTNPVSFAGSQYATEDPVRATYRFNSWRLGYRYRAFTSPTLDVWTGFTAKLRDAEVRLEQGGTTSKDTDLGFVPLLHLAAEWQVAPKAQLMFDFDGLAGGPGRAIDTALKLMYEVHPRLMVGAGYRTLEGGADVDSVYNFAWLHYGLISARFGVGE